MKKYIKRNIEKNITLALKDTPVILVQGARQVGKSTLVEKIANEIDAVKVTLDNEAALNIAKEVPLDFVEQNENGTLVIDEIQLRPQLLRTIKYSVDRNRRPGRFILTGSADVLHVSGANESLAGRIEKIKLNPFSIGELLGVTDDFITRISKPDYNMYLTNFAVTSREKYIELICAGGYPEAVNRDVNRHKTFFENYLKSVLDHDATTISNLAHLDKLEKVFTILSANTSEEFVQTKVSRITGIPETSMNGYIRLLKDIYLINELPAWGRNLTKRAVSRKKVSISDTAIACYLNNDTKEKLLDLINGDELGSLMETFVVNELFKQQTWSETRFSLNHFRDHNKGEVDIIIELSDGRIIALEVKSASSISRNDLAGIKLIKDKTGDMFHCGLILYTGNEVQFLGKNIYAVPISGIWY